VEGDFVVTSTFRQGLQQRWLADDIRTFVQYLLQQLYRRACRHDVRLDVEQCFRKHDPDRSVGFQGISGERQARLRRRNLLQVDVGRSRWGERQNAA
jgi:hypothetical protein